MVWSRCNFFSLKSKTSCLVPSEATTTSHRKWLHKTYSLALGTIFFNKCVNCMFALFLPLLLMRGYFSLTSLLYLREAILASHVSGLRKKILLLCESFWLLHFFRLWQFTILMLHSPSATTSVIEDGPIAPFSSASRSLCRHICLVAARIVSRSFSKATRQHSEKTLS